MYINSGYLNNSRVAFSDRSRPLIVGSAGTYRLVRKKQLPTRRVNGRVDYQILYVAAGKAFFYLKNEDEPTEVAAGHMVLYRPGEMQKYVYYGADRPEVFWVHFTGSQVEEILERYRFPAKGEEQVIYCGLTRDYRWIFGQMIRELQLAQSGFEELLVYLLRHMFLLVNRQRVSGNSENPQMLEVIGKAVQYFQLHYNEPLNIEAYARQIHVSESWFIQKFREYTGVTPMQYILYLRVSNAQELLENSSLPVKEIALIVGYENPLYFSRLFRKQIGVSPKAYRAKSAVFEDADYEAVRTIDKRNGVKVPPRSDRL